MKKKDIDALVKRLRAYNEWRRGGDGPHPDPTQLGIDIDAAIDLLESMGTGKINMKMVLY